MRQIREVLSHKWELGFSARRIACSCGLIRSPVSNCLRRPEAGGLTWPAVARLDDRQLERRLFPPAPSSRVRRPAPDWPAVHRELMHKGVTLHLLWDDYKAVSRARSNVHISASKDVRFSARYRVRYTWLARFSR